MSKLNLSSGQSIGKIAHPDIMYIQILSSHYLSFSREQTPHIENQNLSQTLYCIT